MTRARFPVDEHGTTPSAEDWERADDSLERHLAAASRSPRFDATRNEIAQRQATLADLRRAFQLSQVTLAENLAMSQSELSRLERRADLLLSTLSRFVAATGGQLRLVANYPDRPPIELRLAALTHHRDVEADEAPSQPTRAQRPATVTEKAPTTTASKAARTLTSSSAPRAATSAAKRGLAQRAAGTRTTKTGASKPVTALAPTASRAATGAAGRTLTQPSKVKRG